MSIKNKLGSVIENRLEKFYKVELYGGVMGIRTARSLKEAKKAAIREQGISNVKSVTLATEEDTEWFVAMGGLL